MGLFSQKKSYLGVDIGTASVKLVQLTHENGKVHLDTFGYVDISSDIMHANTPESKQKIVNVLKDITKKANTTTIQTIAALPTFAVFTSVINLPKLPDKELTSAINWEAKKYIPLPLEEMVLDWKLVEQSDNKTSKDEKGFSLFKKKDIDVSQNDVKNVGKIVSKEREYIKVLITAAPKSLVAKYLEIFKDAGLNLLSLETEAFALSRSLLGTDNQSTMVVDLGSITTDISVIDNKIPVLNRSIDVGGLTITKAISNSLNVSMERAEQFKRDFGLSLSDTRKGIPKTIETAIGPIINEMKYVFNLYSGQSNKEIEKILLAGGAAFLPNLSDYFLDLFKVPVYIGNPWSNLEYSDELNPLLDQIGTRMAVAIGLAMRD